jgi:hypothetical protein
VAWILTMAFDEVFGGRRGYGPNFGVLGIIVHGCIATAFSLVISARRSCGDIKDRAWMLRLLVLGSLAVCLWQIAGTRPSSHAAAWIAGGVPVWIWFAAETLTERANLGTRALNLWLVLPTWLRWLRHLLRQGWWPGLCLMLLLTPGFTMLPVLAQGSLYDVRVVTHVAVLFTLWPAIGFGLIKATWPRVYWIYASSIICALLWTWGWESVIADYETGRRFKQSHTGVMVHALTPWSAAVWRPGESEYFDVRRTGEFTTGLRRMAQQPDWRLHVCFTAGLYFLQFLFLWWRSRPEVRALREAERVAQMKDNSSVS